MSQTVSKTSWIFRCITSVALLLASLAIFTSAFAHPDDPTSNAESQVTPDVTVEDASSKEVLAKDSPVVGKGARIVTSFTVFLLAVFVGVEVINKVPPTLHTPLMSGSNAISGITVIGALLAAGHVSGGFGAFLGMIAVILAMVNVAGGFLVTHRMLKMFKKR
jgi:H+-translocating NAD(P) transhydrogenase subunit alpha